MRVDLMMSGWQTAPGQINRVAQALSQVPSPTSTRAGRSQQSPFLRMLTTAVRSTRFSMGGGGGLSIQPLIGQAMNLAMAGGPWGMAIAGTAAALGAVAAAAEAAATRISAFGLAAMQSGATPAEMGRLGSLGQAVGLSPGDMAAMSKQFAETLATSGQAMALFSRYGIRDYDAKGIFTNLDKAANLLKAAAMIRRMSPEDAIRAARLAPEIEPLLRFRNLAEQTMQQLNEDARTRSTIVTPEYQRNAQELETQTNRVGAAAQNAMDASVKPALGPLATIGGHVADALNEAARAINAGSDFWRDPVGWVSREAERLARESAGGASDEHISATAANTAALQDLTLQMGELRAFFGGGPRLQGAIPAGWQGQMLEQALKYQAQTLGPMGV